MLSNAKAISSNKLTSKDQLSRCPVDQDTTLVPEKYNFREKYSNCANPVVNQGNCSSAYSIATSSAIADRFCQQTSLNVPLSYENQVVCDKSSRGCKGGSASRILDLARKQGLIEASC